MIDNNDNDDNDSLSSPIIESEGEYPTDKTPMASSLPATRSPPSSPSRPSPLKHPKRKFKLWPPPKWQQGELRILQRVDVVYEKGKGYYLTVLCPKTPSLLCKSKGIPVQDVNLQSTRPKCSTGRNHVV